MRKKGFTLIELIAVMAIIMTLAGMVMVVSRAALDKAKKSKAESMISALSVAISMFYADTGAYPWSEALPDYTSGAGNTSAQLYEKLMDVNANPANSGWKGPYLDPLREQDLGSLIVGPGQPYLRNILDPWKHPYWYQSVNSAAGGVTLIHHPNSFEIFSAGPNGTYGNTDDITNWQ